MKFFTSENSIINSEKLKKILLIYIALPDISFSSEYCRSLVTIYDQKKSGFIPNEQLVLLLNDLNQCYDIFSMNITSGASDLTGQELKNCFDQMGIHTSSSIIQILLNRYGTVNEATTSEKKPGIDFVNFAVCSLKLRNIIIFWDIKAMRQIVANTSNTDVRGSKRVLTFTLQEFVEQMMYS